MAVGDRRSAARVGSGLEGDAEEERRESVRRWVVSVWIWVRWWGERE